MRHSLFVWLEMREGQTPFRDGELLVRNIVGADQESGALAIGAYPRAQQVLQFVLRDADAARADLDEQLGRYARGVAAEPAERPGPAGALLFSCLGRGQQLFGEPDHDSRRLFEHLGRMPLGGFFCNGEIGQVGGETFLHGYTSCFGVFRPLR
jgi:small ligand-binding sensory domain FIST